MGREKVRAQFLRRQEASATSRLPRAREPQVLKGRPVLGIPHKEANCVLRRLFPCQWLSRGRRAIGPIGKVTALGLADKPPGEGRRVSWSSGQSSVVGGERRDDTSKVGQYSFPGEQLVVSRGIKP